MSDREAIVQVLQKVGSRIRANRLGGKLASGGLVLIFIAVLVKIWDLFLPFSSATITTFWLAWFVFSGLFIARTLISNKGALSQIAAEIDQKANLRNELTSAYWFVQQRAKNPWIELQVHRAAKKAASLDPKRLCPIIIPSTSYWLVGLTVLLVFLNFKPLPLDHNWLYSDEAPLLILDNEDKTLMEEIEELMEKAQTLEQNEAVDQLEELFNAIRHGEISADRALNKLAEIQDLINEGNLSITSLIEGLEEIGRDLQRSKDTRIAGEAMSLGELEKAADELRVLGEELNNGEKPAENLKEILRQAADNVRPGLKELTEKLDAVAEHLQSPEKAQEALEEASLELEELSGMVESQQIKNQASNQLENLQNAVREQLNQGQAAIEQQRQNQMQMEFDQATEQTQLQMGNQERGQQSRQEGQLQTEPEYAPGAVGDAQLTGQAQQPNQQEALEGFGATGTGQMPSGFGFSPEQKEGAPTDLDVQLQDERTEAQKGRGIESEADKIEEVSRSQQSKLDYRNVQSDLEPVHQDLLNQEQIPRKYKSLIKEYFKAIRPRPKP